MAAWLDNVRFNPTLGGTTDWTYSSAVGGYQSPASAGAVNGVKYKYFAIDGSNNWELGEGAWTTSGTILARTTILANSLGTTAKINFAAAPQVAIVSILEDMIPAQAAFGLGMVNGTLVASVASNILTVAVKTFAGNDPSSSDPVFFYFRDATSATGDYVWRSVTSALSINTFSTATTFGTANGVPFRLWVTAFDNAGTVLLGLFQSVTGGASPTAIAPLDESSPASSGSGTSTTPGAHYTSSSLVSKSFRILGYLDYGSGLTTAGSYASVPTKIQLFGHGIKKPGDIVQSVYATNSTGATTTNPLASALQTSSTISITPTSAPNLVRVFASGSLKNDNVAAAAQSRIARTAGPTFFGSHGIAFGGTTSSPAYASANMYGLDAPGTTSSTTYSVYLWTTTSGDTVEWLSNGFAAQTGTMTADELMV